MSFLGLSNEISATILQTLHIDEKDAHYIDILEIYVEWATELITINSEQDLHLG